MNLTWQIVRKDLARLKVPLSLWLLFVVGMTLGFGLFPAPADESSRSDFPGWINGLQGLGLAVAMLQGIVGALLAAVLALEDPPSGTTAFWQTRPISRGRLLGAKTLAGVVGLGLLPTLALTVVWMGLGFTVREIFFAAGEHLAWQIGVLVPALALAVLGGGLGRFLAAGLGVWLLIVFTVIVADASRTEHLLYPTRLDSRGAAIVGTLWLGCLVALGLAYSRRRALAWVVFGATLVAMVVLRVGFPASGMGALAPASPEGERVVWGEAQVEGKPPTIRLLTPGPDAAGRVWAPLAGRLRWRAPGPGDDWIALERSATWGDEAALHVAGLSRDAGPRLPWSLKLGSGAADRLRQDPDPEAGEVRLAVGRLQVLWEIPLQAQATARSGAARARLARVDWTSDGARRRMVVLERDARLAWDEGIGRNLGAWSGRRYDLSRADCFLLVNRSRGYARALALQEIGTARINSVMMTARGLEIEPAVAPGPALESWEEGATLIKVRFTSEASTVHGMPAGRITLAGRIQP